MTTAETPSNLPPITVKCKNFPSDEIPPPLIELLKSAVLKLSNNSEKPLEFILNHLTGSMTNKVYECKDKNHYLNPRKILIRLYGENTSVFFNREMEIAVFERMSTEGQGPKLISRFPYGRVEEFIKSRTLCGGDLRDREISAKIASKLREFHHIDLGGEKKPMLWERMRSWFKTVQKLLSADEFKKFKLYDINSEMQMLEKKLESERMEIGFCHNDLQYGNIMMNDKTGSITLIDYEYSSYNPIAFDIANHFCEWAADYHSSNPHEMDFNKYPTFEQRLHFLNSYFQISEAGLNAENLEKLLQLIDYFRLVSHVHWGLWGIISAKVSDIDFDYLAYALQRFDQYENDKLNILFSLNA